MAIVGPQAPHCPMETSGRVPQGHSEGAWRLKKAQGTCQLQPGWLKDRQGQPRDWLYDAGYNDELGVWQIGCHCCKPLSMQSRSDSLHHENSKTHRKKYEDWIKGQKLKGGRSSSKWGMGGMMLHRHSDIHGWQLYCTQQWYFGGASSDHILRLCPNP